MHFPIIYEDESTLVIDKPAGIMVHEDGRSTEKSVADLLLVEYPAMNGIGDEGRGGIVHRLDKDTTGVLIIAKTLPAFKFFKRQFKDHTTRKVYRAIVEGNIKEDKGMIDAPLARAKSDFRKRTTVDPYSDDARGTEREALTRYKVLARSKSQEGKDYTYVEAYPVTGRTHQIRAHFRSIRHPIIGDDLYGSSVGSKEAVRSMLHAYSLTISLPNQGEKTFYAELHQDMKETLERFGFLC
jgi:23S rRNA pseudouridine1911/1915/1917 synthase